MRKNICEEIRRELDELMLDETCSTVAVEHLRECGSCREFHQKQTKLRQIVGSLGTVAAPADFDFRLRARLANESSSAASHFSFLESAFVRRGLAAAGLLLVFATGVFMVRNVLTRPATIDDVAKQSTPPAVGEIPKPVDGYKPVAPEVREQGAVTLPVVKRPQGTKTERATQLAVRTTRPMATRDSASTGAEVIGAQPVASSAAFPIDASLSSFKVSVDDGRGNAKTISVPTISFGSQRLMQNVNQYAPKRVW
ncbi:MAG TPA: hypothetical protein VFI24_16010 [Pyrinomonadaceae bacterium]|nr:hypothetical protein [Pyrinomonadaceae bacterium]